MTPNINATPLTIEDLELVEMEDHTVFKEEPSRSKAVAFVLSFLTLTYITAIFISLLRSQMQVSSYLSPFLDFGLGFASVAIGLLYGDFEQFNEPQNLRCRWEALGFVWSFLLQVLLFAILVSLSRVLGFGGDWNCLLDLGSAFMLSVIGILDEEGPEVPDVESCFAAKIFW